MGAEIDYSVFIKELDLRLEEYFKSFGSHICCKRGCSECCEKGDYPLSDVELEYLMHGFAKLEPSVKIQVQNNIKNITKGGACPFLINKECSVYPYRPVICRVHGLAYIYEKKKVKIPFCAETGKNFASVYKDGVFVGEPVRANLDTQSLLKGCYNEIRNLYDWLKNPESGSNT